MNAESDASEDQTLSIDEAREQRAQVLEALSESGHTKLVGVLRAVVECTGKLQALDGQGGSEEDGEWPFHGVQRARLEARRLLTGVDEGSYEGSDN